MKKNYLYSFLMFLILGSYLITVNKTNAKFQYVNYGIAWENYYTEFEQLQSVFYIIDPNGDSDTGLFGATTGDNQPTLRDDGFYVVGDSWVSWSGNNTYEENALNTLQNVEFNVANQTASRMVVVFVIHFYAPKIVKSSSYWGNKTNLSFGVYNTYIHESSETAVNLTDVSTAKSVLKGELIVNTGSEVYALSQYDYLPEVVSERLSGAANGEQNVMGTTYYPHLVIINPYSLLYPLNDGESSVPYNYKLSGETEIKNGLNENGNPASYVYCAKDSETNALATDSSISNPDLLDEFILETGEAASFNVNLFCGDFGVTTASNNYSFITSVDMYAFPEDAMKENVTKIRNKEVAAHKLPTISS